MKEEIQKAVELLLDNGYSITKKFDFNNLEKQIKNKQELFTQLNNISILFDLKNKTRTNELTFKRHYFCHFVRKHFSFVYTDIGLLTDRDHTSVIWSIKKYSELRLYKPFVMCVEELKQELNKVL